MGQLIFGKPITVQGQKFNDLKLQASKEGVPRPIIFGKVRPVVGNVIASAKPRIVEIRTKQGGKGGPKVTTVSEEVYRTYAIRICEGPVNGVTRIWQNGEIIFDRDSLDSNQIENNAEFLKIAEIFLGAFDQQPSSVLQGAFGVNEVAAYRGTCYMVIDDQNLTDAGGSIPQYQFEVERCVGSYLTTKPYPYIYSEGVSVSFEASKIKAYPALYENLEGVDVSFSVSKIEQRNMLRVYDDAAPEGVDVSFNVTKIEQRNILRTYDAAEPEGVDVSFNVSKIEQSEVLITYSDAEPEGVDVSFNVSKIETT